MVVILSLIYLIFGRVMPWSLAITLAVFLGRRPALTKSLILLCIVGLLEDVAHIQPFGISSLFLMTVASVTWFIESQYRGKFIWWWLVLGMIAEAVFHRIGGQPIGLIALVGQVGTLAFIQWILTRLGETEGIYVGR